MRANKKSLLICFLSMLTTFVFVSVVSFYYGQNVIASKDVQQMAITAKFFGHDWFGVVPIQELFSDGIGSILLSIIFMGLNSLRVTLKYKLTLLTCMFFYSLNSFMICRISQKCNVNNVFAYLLGVSVPFFTPMSFSDINGLPVVMFIIWIFVYLITNYITINRKNLKSVVTLCVASFIVVAANFLDVRTVFLLLGFFVFLIVEFSHKRINIATLITVLVTSIVSVIVFSFVWYRIVDFLGISREILYKMPGTFEYYFAKFGGGLDRICQRPKYLLGSGDLILSNLWLIGIYTLGLVFVLAVKLFVRKPVIKNDTYARVNRISTIVFYSFGFYLIFNIVVNSRFAYKMHGAVVDMASVIFTADDVYYLIAPVILFSVILVLARMKITFTDVALSMGFFLLISVVVAFSVARTVIMMGYINVCYWFGDNAPVFIHLAKAVSTQESIMLFVFIPLVIAIVVYTFSIEGAWKRATIYLLIIALFQSINYVSYLDSDRMSEYNGASYSDSFRQLLKEKAYSDVYASIQENGLYYIGRGNEACNVQVLVDFPIYNAVPSNGDYIALSVEPYNTVLGKEEYQDCYIVELDENEVLIINGENYYSLFNDSELELLKIGDIPNPMGIINILYRDIFGRNVDIGGFEYFSGALDSGEMDVSGFLHALLLSEEHSLKDGIFNKRMVYQLCELVCENSDHTIAASIATDIINDNNYESLIQYLLDSGIVEYINEEYNVEWN